MKTSTIAAASLLVALGVALPACNEDETSASTPSGGPDTTESSDADDGEASGPVCQTGNVDLLFVIDNSGSMAEEQVKLSHALPELMSVLSTGNRDGKARPPGVPTDFAPATSIHIGVVSTDMGIAGLTGMQSCGDASLDATAADPLNPRIEVRAEGSNARRLDKPFGDDGVLNTSTAVALAGIWTRPVITAFSTPVTQVVAPDADCADVVFPDHQRYIEYSAGTSDLAQVTKQFTCVAKLGKNGCGIEQQLEAMLKAVTPDSSALRFSRATHGQASGPNSGFLRDDAVLAVVHISDEEDCSVPDESRDLFNPYAWEIPEDINVRCGLSKYQSMLHPAERYVSGLRALKSEQHADRVIFAGIVGAPRDDGGSTYMGTEALDALLTRPEMQFSTRAVEGTMLQEPAPTCSSEDGAAAPGRRFIEVARELGDNGIITSICEGSYFATMQLVSERIARHLGSGCTP